jgi:hypothetical protein
MYRQGDITLRPIEKLPEDCRVSFNGNVLVHGETSGHRHWVDTPDQAVYEDFDGNLYVELIEDAVLVHSGPDLKAPISPQEARDKDLHMPLEIKKGVYRLTIETDYDPYEKIWRQVWD